MGVNLAALTWGFAEATLFFVVPDVWLSYVARERLKPGLIACAYALGGALVGGALMYWWGTVAAEGALNLIEMLPAIDRGMIERVSAELVARGPLAVFLGPISGTPYKLYAVQASGAAMGGAMFLLISVPARLLRFVLVTVVSHYALKGVSHFRPSVNRTAILLGTWAAFYAFYFGVMPG